MIWLVIASMIMPSMRDPPPRSPEPEAICLKDLSLRPRPEEFERIYESDEMKRCLMQGSMLRPNPPIHAECLKELGHEEPKTPEEFTRIFDSREMRRSLSSRSNAKWPESLLLLHARSDDRGVSTSGDTCRENRQT
jgi:hypothetical protein